MMVFLETLEHGVICVEILVSLFPGGQKYLSEAQAAIVSSSRSFVGQTGVNSLLSSPLGVPVTHCPKHNSALD